MRHLLALFAALALLALIATPGRAAPVAPPAGATAMPAAQMTPGLVRRYRVETTNTVLSADPPKVTHDVQVIELRVLSVDGQTVSMTSTPISMEGVPAYFAKAYQGRTMPFTARPGGNPTAVPGWDALKNALATAMLQGAADPTAQADAAALLGANEAKAMDTVFIEPRILGRVQTWGQGAAHMTAPVVTMGEGATQARVTSARALDWIDAEAGTMGVSQMGELDPASPVAMSQKVVVSQSTHAVISSRDGWVNTLDALDQDLTNGRGRITVRKFTRLPDGG